MKVLIIPSNSLPASPSGPHVEAICRALIAKGSDVTGDLRPVGITGEFCRLLKNSGCFYVNVSVESASGTIPGRMRRGYTVRDVRSRLRL